jgi:hypothetical protein
MRRIYGDTGVFIAAVGNASANLTLPQLARAMGKHVNNKVLPVPKADQALPDLRHYDQSLFWNVGYNAV